MRFELQEDNVHTPGMPLIKVIGLGGGGGNAVAYMAEKGLDGVEFICANTDAQALKALPVSRKIQLGDSGLGAGAKPEKGREAAVQNTDAIREHLRDADMVFITAGMGGGTGTGAAPVVAQIAREMGVLTVGVVSRPFSFERRGKVAEEGISALREHVDSLIVIPNDKLSKVLGGDFKMKQAFEYANEVLHGAVQGVAELITRPGLINVDFEDVRTVMSCRGYALMGVGVASGEDRAVAATQKAINNPLLEDVKIQGAKGVLVNVTAGPDLTMQEWEDVGSMIDQLADEDASVIVGTSIDPELDGELRVTVVATGLETAGDAQMMRPGVRRRATEKAPEAQPQTVEPVPQAQPVEPAPVMDLEPPVAPVGTGGGQAVVKPRQRSVETAAVKVANGAPGYRDYILDIPTFLRRQAD